MTSYLDLRLGSGRTYTMSGVARFRLPVYYAHCVASDGTTWDQGPYLSWGQMYAAFNGVSPGGYSANGYEGVQLRPYADGTGYTGSIANRTSEEADATTSTHPGWYGVPGFQSGLTVVTPTGATITLTPVVLAQVNTASVWIPKSAYADGQFVTGFSNQRASFRESGLVAVGNAAYGWSKDTYITSPSVAQAAQFGVSVTASAVSAPATVGTPDASIGNIPLMNAVDQSGLPMPPWTYDTSPPTDYAYATPCSTPGSGSVISSNTGSTPIALFGQYKLLDDGSHADARTVSVYVTEEIVDWSVDWSIVLATERRGRMASVTGGAAGAALYEAVIVAKANGAGLIADTTGGPSTAADLVLADYEAPGYAESSPVVAAVPVAGWGGATLGYFGTLVDIETEVSSVALSGGASDFADLSAYTNVVAGWTQTTAGRALTIALTGGDDAPAVSGCQRILEAVWAPASDAGLVWDDRLFDGTSITTPKAVSDFAAAVSSALGGWGSSVLALGTGGVFGPGTAIIPIWGKSPYYLAPYSYPYAWGLYQGGAAYESYAGPSGLGGMQTNAPLLSNAYWDNEVNRGYYDLTAAIGTEGVVFGTLTLSRSLPDAISVDLSVTSTSEQTTGAKVSITSDFGNWAGFRYLKMTGTAGQTGKLTVHLRGGRGQWTYAVAIGDDGTQTIDLLQGGDASRMTGVAAALSAYGAGLIVGHYDGTGYDNHVTQLDIAVGGASETCAITAIQLIEAVGSDVIVDPKPRPDQPVNDPVTGGLGVSAPAQWNGALQILRDGKIAYSFPLEQKYLLEGATIPDWQPAGVRTADAGHSIALLDDLASFTPGYTGSLTLTKLTDHPDAIALEAGMIADPRWPYGDSTYDTFTDSITLTVRRIVRLLTVNPYTSALDAIVYRWVHGTGVHGLLPGTPTDIEATPTAPSAFVVEEIDGSRGTVPLPSPVVYVPPTPAPDGYFRFCTFANQGTATATWSGSGEGVPAAYSNVYEVCYAILEAASGWSDMAQSRATGRIWVAATDASTGNVVVTAYHPYSFAVDAVRDTGRIGTNPVLLIDDRTGIYGLVYRNVAGVMVYSVSKDQFGSVEIETVLFTEPGYNEFVLQDNSGGLLLAYQAVSDGSNEDIWGKRLSLGTLAALSWKDSTTEKALTGLTGLAPAGPVRVVRNAVTPSELVLLHGEHLYASEDGGETWTVKV